MSLDKIKVGDVIKGKSESPFVILSIDGYQRICIKFLDEFGHTMTTTAQKAVKGQPTNPYCKTMYGVGYIGVGTYRTSVDHKRTPQYAAWSSMFTRIYGKYSPSYSDCSIDPTWYNFQNFALWFDQNRVEGWFLDKDCKILGSRMYGPTTCCFVPRDVNNQSMFKSAFQNRLNLNVFYGERDNNYYAFDAGKYFKRQYEAILCQKAAIEDKIKMLYNKYKDSELDTKVLKNLLEYKYLMMIPLCLQEALWNDDLPLENVEEKGYLARVKTIKLIMESVE